MKVFTDTSYLIAFYDVNDQFHNQSVSILKSSLPSDSQLLISDYIYDEVLTYFITRYGYRGYLKSKIFDLDVSRYHKIHLSFINDLIWMKAREMFFKFNRDKKFSFTDCTSFALMKDLGLKDVLSFDHHFQERGYKIIIPG